MQKFEYQVAVGFFAGIPQYGNAGTLEVEADSRTEALELIERSRLREAVTGEWPLGGGGIEKEAVRIRTAGAGTAWEDAETHRFGIRGRLTYELCESPEDEGGPERR